MSVPENNKTRKCNCGKLIDFQGKRVYYVGKFPECRQVCNVLKSASNGNKQSLEVLTKWGIRI